ncbi:MAG: hypothetical protein ER33_00130 [Cyanobium sp. CACIAM 14]|nr:MAG: hypothetical protein ER33_00130 [Cyanobium sp. CACIAM 14]
MRWIPSCRLGGAWQMAIDAWLLDRSLAAADPLGQVSPSAPIRPVSVPVFRLYRWARPTLSLGWHQRRLEPHWMELARRGRIDLVRRPSGGRAVLHGTDLTYALVWPRPRGSRSEVYGRALQWLVHAFAAMGLPLRTGQRAAGAQRSSCFATATVADLVHDGGAKRVGSAQLWRGGHLLQHGSIQLAPCPSLWREVFGADPPPLDPLPLEGEALEEHLRRSALRWLPMDNGGEGATGQGSEDSLPPETPLSAAELALIAPTLSHYRPTWPFGGVTSPELTMPRAT